jgi:hypothetical protein
MDYLQEQIRETLINAPSGVHGIIYGPKTVKGELTDINSIIYLVEKKLPLFKIPENERIPKDVNFGQTKYTTDVIQSPKLRLNQCYNLSDQEVLDLQTRIRPLSGGIEISALNTWDQPAAYDFNYEFGTLGFLAVDNNDNKLVGVTNNHVIIKDAFENVDKNLSEESSSIIDNITFSYEGGYNGTFTNRILQFGSILGSVNFINDSIGYPKRYVPISESGVNTVDGAIFTINTGAFNSTSSSQAYLSGSYAMPFCNTTEVNLLSSNEYPIYSVGRTTGPKGINCPLVVYGSGSALIDYNKQGIPTEVAFSEIIFYRFLDSSNLPTYKGDSGSSLVANISGTYKIAGLVFAGDTNDDPLNPTSTLGAACRIDKVAQQLNISAWNGSAISTSSTTPQKSILIRPITDTRTSIVSGGKTFYLAGTIKTNSPVNNI